MSLAFPRIVLIAVALLCTAVARAEAPATQPLVLHIAADPNNLPFSNERQEGFENKIASLIARDLGATIQYTWWAQRRGFFREAVKHGESDLVMGVPANFDRLIPTRPYYRSTYVFVSRKDRAFDLHSFDDPALQKLKIGIPLVGGSNNSPPAQALADRGMVNNLAGYSLYNDYRQANPASEIVAAVAKGDVDVAVVWGPIGGYFAKRQDVPLTVSPVDAPRESSTLFAFDISIGVKRGHSELKKRIDEILVQRKEEIDQILKAYDVPLLPVAAGAKRADDNDAKR
jgi:quinoprotein dehydrogenase-associated probable ABC transporter substrate-binding protein